MTGTQSSLERKLAAGTFVLTAEVCPPKGSDCTEFVSRAKAFSGVIDAINVTDNQGANMRISSLAASHLLVREGIEPIFQITCRDRNRLALQSDLLGAAALGICTVLALTGDHLSFGDHREGKAVFDLDSTQLLEVMQRLRGGHDLAGKALTGAPAFFAGAAAAPEAEPFELTLFKLRKKIGAGARFIQTQAVFRPGKMAQFAEAVTPWGVKTITGILVLKSAAMARFINRNIPGLRIPDDIVDELEQAANPAQKGVEIACRLAREVKPFCDGIHIMAMGREEIIPEIAQDVRQG